MTKRRGERGAGGSDRVAAAVAAAVLALSLLFRLSTFGDVFRGETPRVPPFDDQYHALRIVHSALRFPAVLDVDPDRGVGGAACPWPPLYDLAAGGLARLLGGRAEADVLARAAWLPVAVMPPFLALLSFFAVRRHGTLGGVSSALALVLSLPLVAVSRLGSLDHHFLEAPLLALVVVATLRAAAVSSRAALRAGLLLGGALVAALFVQTAFLFAAALAFVALFLLAGSERPPLVAGALGFALAAAAVAAYGAVRSPRAPLSEWFLGAPHAAALAAAAVALGALALLLERGAGEAKARGLAILLGGASAAAVPGALPAFGDGAGFFAGDRWLSTIREFQPLVFGSPSPFEDLLLAGGGGILVLLFARDAFAGPDREDRVVTIFALGYLLACVASRRFLVAGVPLFILAGGAAIAERRRGGSPAAALVTASILVLPALAGGWLGLRRPEPFEPAESAAFERAARVLAVRIDAPGRVLGPWSWGHLLHRCAGRPVVVDNFGAMLGRREFDEALAVTLWTREEHVARWCRENGVRFVVLENPLTLLSRQAETIGVPASAFLRPGAGPSDPPSLTHLARATFWWRAYFGRGGALPPAGSRGAPFRFFRLAYADPEPSADPPPYRGPLVQIWELAAP